MPSAITSVAASSVLATTILPRLPARSRAQKYSSSRASGTRILAKFMTAKTVPEIASKSTPTHEAILERNRQLSSNTWYSMNSPIFE